MNEQETIKFSEGELKACLVCNIPIKALGSLERRAAKKFCSRQCRGISERKLPTRQCLVCSAVFSISSSQLKNGYGVYCSQICYGKSQRTERYGSDKNELIRKSKEYREWRHKVFGRDKFTCQTCGVHSGLGFRVELVADHIKPFCDYIELRFDVNNGRTLCKECHYKTPTYGRRSNKV